MTTLGMLYVKFNVKNYLLYHIIPLYPPHFLLTKNFAIVALIWSAPSYWKPDKNSFLTPSQKMGLCLVTVGQVHRGELGCASQHWPNQKLAIKLKSLFLGNLGNSRIPILRCWNSANHWATCPWRNALTVAPQHRKAARNYCVMYTRHGPHVSKPHQSGDLVAKRPINQWTYPT